MHMRAEAMFRLASTMRRGCTNNDIAQHSGQADLRCKVVQSLRCEVSPVAHDASQAEVSDLGGALRGEQHLHPRMR